MLQSLAVLAFAALPLAAQNTSASRIREHTRFLSSDLLEGRGVGARGGDLATEYIATQFALAGAQAGGRWGTYLPEGSAGGRGNPARRPAFRRGRRQGAWNFAGWTISWGSSQKQEPETRFEGEAVFVGHGITAPEWKWDDFKGVDVKGKVLVLFTNEPASTDPKFFDGRALTYYGRWIYKYEEALRRGAAGAIIIHTTPTAGYGWEVVRNSWGARIAVREAGAGRARPGFSGLGDARSRRETAGAGREERRRTAGGVRKARFPAHPAGNPDPRNACLPRCASSIRATWPAIVPGSDPKLKDEVVVFSAHWDHLGIGTPVDGDSIYNGAIDNATGCAILMELARAWAALAQKPRRTALFLSVTAEEGGLRGSEYYAAHPLFPPAKTAHGPELRRALSLGTRARTW